jgi:hypothetical protein
MADKIFLHNMLLDAADFGDTETASLIRLIVNKPESLLELIKACNQVAHWLPQWVSNYQNCPIHKDDPMGWPLLEAMAKDCNNAMKAISNNLKYRPRQ